MWVPILIVLIAIFFYSIQKRNYTQIPKKIWTYWGDSDEPPCLSSWKQFNPGYEVIVLTKKNYQGYVTIPPELRKEPLIPSILRVWALVEHGGVWMDATVFLNAPLEDWMFPKYGEFAGFYREAWSTLWKPKKEDEPPERLHPVIETWFMACNKRSLMLEKWKQELKEVARFSCVEQYMEDRKKMGVNIQRIPYPIENFLQVALQKVQQMDQYPMESILLQSSEKGPIQHMVEAKGDPEKSILHKRPIVYLSTEEYQILKNRL